GEHRFVRAAEVPAPLNLASLPLNDFNGIVIAQAREGRLCLLELGEVALQDLELYTTMIEDAPDHETDQFLRQEHRIVEVGKRHFRLDHPELGQVAAGLGFFGAKRRPE